MSGKPKGQSARKIVEALREYLASELKYGEGTLKTYKAPWDGLVWYAEHHGYKIFTAGLGEKFLSDYYGIPDDPCPLISAAPLNLLKYQRAIRMVEEFAQYGKVFRYSNLPEYTWHSALGDLFVEFINHLNETGTRHGTKMTIQYAISYFDKFLKTANIERPADIDQGLIHEYVLSLAGFKSSTIGNYLLAVKKFFAFLHEKGYADEDLSAKVPRCKTLVDYGVPSTFTHDEIERTLAAVNTRTAIGKRDYAMLCIAAHLGLRQGDILNLEPGNFDWENNLLVFSQSKTEHLVSLPLPGRVGRAVIGYLKNGRPDTACPKLFVMHKSPYGPFENAWYVIHKYMDRAGIADIETKRHGFHSLRHSLAGAMLDAETPLPVISEVLGHISSNTTSRYLKIDIPRLRDCALEVDL